MFSLDISPTYPTKINPRLPLLLPTRDIQTWTWMNRASELLLRQCPFFLQLLQGFQMLWGDLPHVPRVQSHNMSQSRNNVEVHINTLYDDIWCYVFSVGICFFSQSARVKTDCVHGESSSAVRTSQDRSHASAVRAFSKVFSSSEILVPCRAWRCLEARRDTAIAGRQTGGWAIGIMDFSKLWPSTPHVRPPGTKESATSVTAWMELGNSAVDGMLRYTAKKREMSKTSWWIQKIIQNRKIQVGKFQCAHDHSS